MRASKIGAIRTAFRPGIRNVRLIRKATTLRIRHLHSSSISYLKPGNPPRELKENSLPKPIKYTEGKKIEGNYSEDSSTDPSHKSIEDIEEKGVESNYIEDNRSTEDTEGNGIKGNDGEDSSSKSGHNSASRRTKILAGQKLKRSRQNPKNGLPPIEIPEWFLHNNVHYGEGHGSIELTEYPVSESDIENERIDVQGSSLEENSSENRSLSSISYSLNQNVYTEILATLKAGLSLRPPNNTATQTTLRPISVLQCQKQGGSVYLDHIVYKLSSDLGADLVQIDAQDIAQIVGPYLDENLAWNVTTTSLYGYNAQKVSGRIEEYDDCKKGDQDPDQNSQGVEESAPPSIFGSIGLSSSFITEDFSKLLNVFVQKPRDNSRSASWSNDVNNSNNRNVDPRDRTKQDMAHHNPWDDLKANAVLKAIVEAADFKRATERQNMSLESSQLSEDKTKSENFEISEISDEPEHSQPENVLQPLIIQIKDYQELRSLDGGTELLQKLQKIINKKWLDGRKIICVGTTEGVEAVYDKRTIQILQEDIIGAEKRTIFVPPERQKAQDLQFKLDTKFRIRKMNIRHLEDMILKLAEGNESLPIVELEKNLDSATIFTSGLEENVWTFPRVHRIAITLLGLSDLRNSSTEPLIFDGISLGRALSVLSSSDEVKFSWGAEEMKKCDALITKVTGSNRKTSKLVYNTYEKKLLSGVVLPEKIQTTFADIRAPKETIEALKTLTNLSLTRPEAFTYGILRRDKIPGILLYGPPGTGKTLLAKAVAKESQATVLEVTAADLNNMYVGEGEKNVKALFTLARKLSPCVIFIDEADSMFGSREGSRQRASHREMINQFLREWDGISDFNGFIMVASNRPYDLDDAILRRLPRRLLVDLPVEKDREEILKIHLKDEVLDKSVCLSALARNTQFYSGSDLKNLCVAAALSCVREENEHATQHEGEETYEYPKVRVLSKRHFDKAIEEISASINEDMSSLKAIKKFDEKYGDRKGRRKKGPGLGFGGTQILELDSDAVRVRPLVND